MDEESKQLVDDCFLRPIADARILLVFSIKKCYLYLFYVDIYAVFLTL